MFFLNNIIFTTIYKVHHVTVGIYFSIRLCCCVASKVSITIGEANPLVSLSVITRIPAPSSCSLSISRSSQSIWQHLCTTSNPATIASTSTYSKITFNYFYYNKEAKGKILTVIYLFIRISLLLVLTGRVKSTTISKRKKHQKEEQQS